jgi:hypothetical protein
VPTSALAVEDEELMAKGKDLCVKRSSLPKERLRALSRAERAGGIVEAT